MVKHKRWSDKPKKEDSNSIEYEKVEEFVPELEIQTKKTPLNIKSQIVSGTKYLYIIAAAALLSGIFTPLTVDAEIEQVVYGMLAIFLGLAGGIIIFLGIKNQKFTVIMVGGGLAIMIASLILIFEIANRSLFG